MTVKINGENVKITWDAVLGAAAVFITLFGTLVIVNG